MDVETIRSRRDEIRERMAEANAEIDRCRLEMRLLKTYCHHLNSYPTSHMGESCQDCPDCGQCV